MKLSYPSRKTETYTNLIKLTSARDKQETINVD